jgi:hypothetical protein
MAVIGGGWSLIPIYGLTIYECESFLTYCYCSVVLGKKQLNGMRGVFSVMLFLYQIFLTFLTFLKMPFSYELSSSCRHLTVGGSKLIEGKKPLTTAR